MVKIIMFDIDGTLRDEKLGVLESTKKAIEECKKLNIYVGICTGRIYSMIQDEVIELDFDIVVSGDGSQILIQDELIQDLYFSSKDIKEILKTLNSEEYGIAIETRDQIFMNKIACSFLSQCNQEKGILEKKITYEDTIHQFQVEDARVSKVCIWSLKKLHQREDVHYVQIVEKQRYYYEIVPLLAGKGNAMKTIRTQFHINKEDILCFGDGLNDLGMFQECGISIAMEDGVDELKQIADAICLSTTDDGIYQELVKREIIKGESI